MKAVLARNLLHMSLILIISIFFVFDLFIHEGVPVTFDGPTHISNMAQTYGALKDGDFPARWGFGFARYGWPAPQFAQQVPAYLGAIINFVTNNVVLSYNIVVFITIFSSALLMYGFLKLYVNNDAAFIGALLFNFAPYRIMNVYIRGALPELMASIFILLILISLNFALKKQLLNGYLLLTISICLLLLTHPFMFIVGSFLFIPYGLYLLYTNSQRWKLKIGAIAICLMFSLGLAGYYILPLFLEIKYLYYGSTISHYIPNQMLSFKQYFSDTWFYFSETDVGPRVHYHNGGLIEGAILVAGIFYSIREFIKNKKIISLQNSIILVGVLYIIFTLPLTEFLYQNVLLLGNIQHPWRMLTGYIFIAPIIIALLVDKVRSPKIIMIVLIVAIGIIRFPQLYGKNYSIYPQKAYFETYDNLHGTNLNTVWMGEVRDYPFKKNKIEIFEGKGKVIKEDIENSKREYAIEADSALKVVDYTFYFPGWKVYIDNQEVPIQFQNPQFRGVITYEVPKGSHTVKVIFQNTKVRILGNMISIFSILILFIVFYNRKHAKQLFDILSRMKLIGG